MSIIPLDILDKNPLHDISRTVFMRFRLDTFRESLDFILNMQGKEGNERLKGKKLSSDLGSRGRRPSFSQTPYALVSQLRILDTNKLQVLLNHIQYNEELSTK